MTEQREPTERYHGLDALRAAAMLGGIALHAATSYVEPSLQFWPVVDDDRSFRYLVLLFVVHSFRMQVFFLLAGFFAVLLLERRGLPAFCLHRTKRIVLPLIIAVILLVPLVDALFIAGYNQRDFDGRVTIGQQLFDMSALTGDIGEFFRSGRFLSNFYWFHLWFLWYLLFIYLLMLASLPIVRLRFGRWLEQGIAHLIGSRWRACWLALPTTLVMIPMHDWQVDTPVRFWPQPTVLVYYTLFFVTGGVLYQQRALLSQIARDRWLSLLGGGLLVAPIAIGVQWFGPYNGSYYRPELEVLALFVYCLLTWLMVFGWLGVFHQYFARPRRWIRLIADSSYWQYLVHLPIVIGLQMLLLSWAVSCDVKFVVVTILTFLVLLISYRYLVQPTWIGTLLNGPRKK